MRTNFNLLKNSYQKIGKGKVRLTQSSLMLIQKIESAKQNYNFPVLENEGAKEAEEIRLNINDEFIASQLGLYLGVRISIVSEEQETPPPPPEGEPLPPGKIAYKNDGNYLDLFTYMPFEKIRQMISLMPLYNGYLKIAVNNVTFVDKWDTRKHHHKPLTQIVRANNSFDTNRQVIDLQNNWNYAKVAMYPVTPMVTLSGAKKNDITLQLPQSLLAGNTMNFNYADDDKVKKEYLKFTFESIVLFMRGYLAQNGAKFQ